jgi:hypothetical protein
VIPSSTRLCHGLSSLVVIQICSRGTPESLIPLRGISYMPRALCRGNCYLANLLLIAISKSGVDVAIAGLQGSLYSRADLTRLRLPCSKADGWDLCACVELQL